MKKEPSPHPKRGERAHKIGAFLEPSTIGSETRGFYTILKQWYQNASAQVLKPSRTIMENVGGYFQTLYQMEEPHAPGLLLSTHVNPAEVNDKISSEVEAETVVLRLGLHRVGGHTHLCAEKFNQWRQEA